MAFIVANVTQAQLDIIIQRGIPHQIIPDELVVRFRAIIPEQMTAEDALIRLVKIAILNAEAQAFTTQVSQAADQQARARRAALQQELGL